MSEHLFQDPRATRTPSRQSSLVAASVIVHVAVLLALVVIGILLPGVLPAPHTTALAWPAMQPVRIADIPLPPQRIKVPKTAAPQPQSDVNAAPVSAPVGISPEPEAPPAIVPTPGVVDGPGFAAISTVTIPPPPPSPPRPAAAVRLHSGIAAPVKIRDVAPEYPVVARAAGARGVVIIEATVDSSGDVVSTRVLRSVPLLDDAALTAVRQWKYTPARLNGEAVSVLITVTVNFTLGR